MTKIIVEQRNFLGGIHLKGVDFPFAEGNGTSFAEASEMFGEVHREKLAQTMERAGDYPAPRSLEQVEADEGWETSNGQRKFETVLV